MDTRALFPPQDTECILQASLDALLSEFEADPEGQHFQGHNVGWIACREAYQLKNVVPSMSGIALVLSGSKYFHSAQGDLRCPRGTLALFPMGVPVCLSNVPEPLVSGHDAASTAQAGSEKALESRYVALCVNFPSEMLAACQAEAPSLEDMPARPPTLAQWTVFLELLEQLLRLVATTASQRLVGKYLEMLGTLLCEWGLGQVLLQAGHNVPAQVRDIVRTDIMRRWTLADIADHLHVSERTLRRHLEQHGTGLRELLRSERLHAGLALLQQRRQSVEEVAYACGYVSASRFARRFHELFGVLPHQMRQARGDWGESLAYTGGDISKQCARV